jgi:hypothetical protein
MGSSVEIVQEFEEGWKLTLRAEAEKARRWMKEADIMMTAVVCVELGADEEETRGRRARL